MDVSVPLMLVLLLVCACLLSFQVLHQGRRARTPVSGCLLEACLVELLPSERSTHCFLVCLCACFVVFVSSYALLEIGHSLFSGRGTRKDTEKAFAFYKQSANQNVSEAENSVGIMLEEGVGTIQDIDQAIYWYTRAASRGNADAIYNLGLLYEQGKGVEKDPKLSLAKFKEAADLGSVQAKVRLEQEKMRGAQQQQAAH